MFYNINIDLNKSGELKIDKKPEDFLALWKLYCDFFK